MAARPLVAPPHVPPSDTEPCLRCVTQDSETKGLPGEGLERGLRLPYPTGWQLVTVDLSLLSQATWAEKHDGVLDLSRIVRFGLVLVWDDTGAHTVWIDDCHLGL